MAPKLTRNGAVDTEALEPRFRLTRCTAHASTALTFMNVQGYLRASCRAEI